MALSALQEQSGPQRIRFPQHVERPSAAIESPEPPRPHKLIQIHPSLADIVERITDWDIPDDEVARATMPKALPSTTPYLIVQYRVPIRSDRHFGSAGYRHRKFTHVVNMIGTGVVTVRPNGPLGLLVVHLKPETAAGLVGSRMHDFINEKINLGDVFNASDVSLLEEMLMEAPDSAARFARIEKFLLRSLRQCRPDAVACKAAQCLRRNPSLRVRGLAAQLDVCERHLSRSFRAMFGTSPKQFARIARIEKILAMKQAGFAWADIAYGCGFADQAHMINDFDAIVGQTPEQLFRTSALDVDWQANAPIGRLAG
ncbi:AraC-like DNA-binding protein [Nitrobacteraceae bacterium AZCC 1564]